LYANRSSSHLLNVTQGISNEWQCWLLAVKDAGFLDLLLRFRGRRLACNDLYRPTSCERDIPLCCANLEWTDIHRTVMSSQMKVLTASVDLDYSRLRLRYDRLCLNQPFLLKKWRKPAEQDRISEVMHEWNTSDQLDTPGGVVQGVDSFAIYRICVTARGSMSSEALMQQRLEDISWINKMIISWYNNVSEVQEFFGLNLRDVEFKNGVAVFKVRI
jgi:hypothetical protein